MQLFTSTLLAVTVPSVTWSPKVACVMIFCNIVAIAFVKLTFKDPGAGGALPTGNLTGGFSLSTALTAYCGGHIIGAGAILGLASMGAL